MERIDTQTLHLISYLTLVVTVAFYMFLAYSHSKTHRADRADTYLRYRQGNLTESGISGDLLRSTLMASAFSLASAIYVYIDWAAYEGVFALWSPIAWAVGALILFALRTKIFNESRDSWTIHGFLKKRYDSEFLMRLASLVTTAVFLLQIAAEVFVGIAVLQVFFGLNTPLFVLCVLIGAIFIGYTLIGGLPSVLITDFYQNKIIAFALGVVAVFLFDAGGKTAVHNILASFSTSFVPKGGNWIVLLSLFALNIPIFITDMSVWQRIGATSRIDEVTKGLGKFTVQLFLWMSLLVFLGVGFVTYFTEIPDLTPAKALITYFSDTFVYPLLIVGLIAALLSTADTFLISSVLTLLVDWRYNRQLQAVNYNPDDLDVQTHRVIVRDSRFGVLILGFGSVVAGYFFYSYLPSLLNLLFVVFGLQTCLAPIVLWGLYGRATSPDKPAAIASVLTGGALTIFLLILALSDINMFGVNAAFWSPILVFLVSGIVFFSVRLFGHRTKLPEVTGPQGATHERS